jgi:membrane associated rhomboid family serine protease
MALIIVAVTLAAYLIELAAGGYSVCEAYGLVPARFVDSVDWTLISSVFLHHPEDLAHIAGNMVALAVFGPVVERALGGARFLGLYGLAGVLGGLLHVAVDPSTTSPLVGASGAVFGVVAVAAAVRPRLVGFAVALAGYEVWRAFEGDGTAVSFGAHLGGFAAGVLVAGLLRAVDSPTLETA